MLSPSDFNPTCNFTLPTLTQECTPSTCCLAQGQIQYLPNLPANALFAAIFGLLLLPNLALGIHRRTWSFMSWMSLGLLGEITGYIGRIMLHNNIFDFNAFLTYLIPLTIAPAFITASVYLCLARVVCVLDPRGRSSRLRPMTYTKIFVGCDVVSLVLQGAGGGVAATADGDRKMGDLGVDIMVAGLATQVVSLVVFSALCADFAFRLWRGVGRSGGGGVSGGFDADTAYGPGVLAKRPSWMVRSAEAGGSAEVDYAAIRRSKMFKGFIGALVCATVLIFVRSCYRLAELQEGFNGNLANNEVLFMILEGPMIILACGALMVFHPGFALKGLWSMKDFQEKKMPAEAKVMMTRTGVSPQGSEDGLTAAAGERTVSGIGGGGKYERVGA